MVSYAHSLLHHVPGRYQEVDPTPFGGVPRRAAPRQHFFTLEEQQSEFVRLRKELRNRNVKDNDLWVQASRNLSLDRTRGLEQLGGEIALAEFEPGATFRPVDRELDTRDLLGGFREGSRQDLEVQIGPLQDEVNAGAPAVLPIDQATLFRFLRRINPGMDGDKLMGRVRHLDRVSRTRGFGSLSVDQAIAEFDPTTDRRLVERDDALELAARGLAQPFEWAAECLAGKLPSNVLEEFIATGRVSRKQAEPIAFMLADCLVEQGLE